MSGNTEKRMIADTGYEVKQAIHLGDREILLAENMNEPDGQFYVKAEYTTNGIIGQYDRMIYSSTYLAIMEEFIGSVDRQIVALRNELVNYDPMPITADKCYPHDYEQDITGEVVAIKASALRSEYRRGDVQLVFVTHGNGAKANPSGTGVYCFHLNDGKQTRYERYDVLGRIKEIPEWAKERLEIIQSEREPVQQTKPEKIAGYTITKRVQVGQKEFVLGENPKAPSPYATWQHMEGRTGYDWGHYYQSRDKALADLHERANNERENLASGKSRKAKNRDDAR